MWVALMRIKVGKTASNRLGVELTHNKMNNIEFEKTTPNYTLICELDLKSLTE